MFLCLYINQNQTGSCSSLLYTCMIKHHDYPSLHKAWKGCFKVILLYGYPFISQIYHALSKHTDTRQRQVSLPLTWSKICQLSIHFFKNDLLVNTSENQILLVAKLLEGCHNNSSFTLRLLHGLNGNLMMLGKSQELLIFAPKNINIKNFLQSTSDLR